MNKFKQFANIERKNIQIAKDARIEDSPKTTPMQKVATMLVTVSTEKITILDFEHNFILEKHMVCGVGYIISGMGYCLSPYFCSLIFINSSDHWKKSSTA